MRVSSIFLTALALFVPVNAIKAFSGSSCNGNAGKEVNCDDSCHSFDDRHSFRVQANTGEHCVTMYAEAGCPNEKFTRRFSFSDQHGQCQNVNTGTNVRSFKCSRNNICII